LAISAASTARNRPRTVTVGILTYQRPKSLARTLASLGPIAMDQPGRTWRIHDILVIDNDAQPTARAIVEELVTSGFPLAVRYRHEPTPGLAAARNRALDEAEADVLVFIDDDETAEAGWPDGLITTMDATGAALVGGPVRTAFAAAPPRWIIDGGFFDRPEPPDRTPQTWLRSGNLALDLAQVTAHSLRFDEQFGLTGGEDTDFSLRAYKLGLGLQWSSTAVVTEIVGPDRTTIGWLTRRERRSTANWVRAELAQHGNSPVRRVLIASRGLVRLGQGSITAVAGLVQRRPSRMVRGLVVASRGIGSLHGLLGGRSTAYGQPITPPCATRTVNSAG
jgi:succinoglycan biosynthesis protein ExoM